MKLNVVGLQTTTNYPVGVLILSSNTEHTRIGFHSRVPPRTTVKSLAYHRVPSGTTRVPQKLRILDEGTRNDRVTRVPPRTFAYLRVPACDFADATPTPPSMSDNKVFYVASLCAASSFGYACVETAARRRWTATSSWTEGIPAYRECP